jgi:hypothetical protein
VSFRRIHFGNSQRSGEELLQKAIVNNEFVELEIRDTFKRAVSPQSLSREGLSAIRLQKRQNTGLLDRPERWNSPSGRRETAPHLEFERTKQQDRRL